MQHQVRLQKKCHASTAVPIQYPLQSGYMQYSDQPQPVLDCRHVHIEMMTHRRGLILVGRLPVLPFVHNLWIVDHHDVASLQLYDFLALDIVFFDPTDLVLN